MRNDYSDTFVGKEKYHFEEHIEVNHVGHRTSGGSGQRMNDVSSLFLRDLPRIWPLRSCHTSAPSELNPPALIAPFAAIVIDRAKELN